MLSRPYVLAETNWKAVSTAPAPYEVAILPWGATEAHNYHLPYATDTIQSEQIAIESARLASNAGARVMVLPAVPFGVQTGQLDIPFCLNVNPSTQLALLRDLATALGGQGIRKLLVLNGHGGNDFRPILRELQPQVPVFLSTMDWYRCVDPRPFFTEPGDHAGELETSVMMHLAPRLVLPLGEAGSGAQRRSRVEALREGWAWAPRRWTQISADTGVGNPAASSAEKGAAFVEAVTQRVGGFLVELAALDLDDMYTDDGAPVVPPLD